MVENYYLLLLSMYVCTFNISSLNSILLYYYYCVCFDYGNMKWLIDTFGSFYWGRKSKALYTWEIIKKKKQNSYNPYDSSKKKIKPIEFKLQEVNKYN